MFDKENEMHKNILITKKTVSLRGKEKSERHEKHKGMAKCKPPEAIGGRMIRPRQLRVSMSIVYVIGRNLSPFQRLTSANLFLS